MTRANVATNLLLNCICHWSRLPTQYIIIIIIIIIIVKMLLSTTKVVKSLKLVSSKNHK